MENQKIHTEVCPRGALGMVRVLLRGAGQVMFQNNAWTGLLFLVGIFWGACSSGSCLMAWGALLGLAVSTLTGFLLRLPESEGAQGLWGFNGILVGCALPTFLGNTPAMWFALVLCSALTTWVRTGFNNAMAPWKVNSFTFPFVFCTWIFLLAARAMHGMPPIHMTAPALPAAIGAGAADMHLDLAAVAVSWLRGIAQVFLADSWITGLVVLAGLAASNVWAALWAAIGSAVALLEARCLGVAPGAATQGLYCFSSVLTAIALATVFYRPSVYSALWALLGILTTVFVQAAMNVLLMPLGLAALTGPFCVTAWLFLLPLIRFECKARPDHSDWSVENKPHLARRRRADE